MEPGYIAIFILAAQAALIVSGITNSTEIYRIPNFYADIKYKVFIDLLDELFIPKDTKFLGTVEINMRFRYTTKHICLHFNPDWIELNRVTLNNIEINSTQYSINNVTEILTVPIDTEVNNVDWYSLYIEYTGNITTTGLIGLYRSSYVNENGTIKYLLTTHLAPAYARRLFPCFDEPEFKATFRFKIRFPIGLNVLFNTRESNRSYNKMTGTTTVSFRKTPQMSTYLLAFVVSDLTCTTHIVPNIVPLQVCSRKALESQRELAGQITPRMLLQFDEITKFNYSQAMEKLDLVAVPDFSESAMENWGLIIFRETNLLYNSTESPQASKDIIIRLITHELAHQWFGNLVTIEWWSEIFLNEGMATYMEYYALHQEFPEHEYDKRFVLDSLHIALDIDGAYEYIHPLHSNVTNVTSIVSAFDIISYHKGGSIMRMVQHFLGIPRLRLGLQNYISIYQYGNANSEGLWLELDQFRAPISKMPANLSTIMENWIKKPGYPLITVDVDDNNVNYIKIAQHEVWRSLESGKPTKWYIPISYTIAKDKRKFQSTTPNFWLTPDRSSVQISLPLGWKWIILNNQQIGYYRVHYEERLLKRIFAALHKKNFDGIIDINRAQIINDLLHLATVNLVKYGFILDNFKFLKQDTSYYPWRVALEGYDGLLRIVGQTTNLGKGIVKDLLGMIGKIYDSVNRSNIRENDNVYKLKQALVYKWACDLGYKNCTDKMIKLFGDYRHNGTRPTLELRQVVYCTGLTHSEDIHDWEYMWDAYLDAEGQPAEQEIIRSALACTTNKKLLRSFLMKSVSENSGIRPQDSSAVILSVGSRPGGIDVAFDFFIENQDQIFNHSQDVGSLQNVFLKIVERFWSYKQINKLRDRVYAGRLKKELLAYADKALFHARAIEHWLDNNLEELEIYYNIEREQKRPRISLTEATLISISPILLALLCVWAYNIKILEFLNRIGSRISAIFNRYPEHPTENINMNVFTTQAE